MSTLNSDVKAFRGFLLFTPLFYLCCVGGLTPPPAVGQPVLGISLDVTNVSVSWTGSGFWLQAADYADTPMPWYNTPWQPTNVANQCSASIPLNSQTRYFRLVASTSLPPPTELVASPSDGVMYVNWDTVSNAVTYNLYISTDPAVSQGDFDSVMTGVLTPPVFLYDLTPGTTYYFVATAVDVNNIESADSNTGSGLFGSYGVVEGSIYTEIFDGISTNQIYLPGITVSMTNPTNGIPVAQAVTDNNGDFQMLLVPAGTFELCWGPCSGYIAGCNSQFVVVSNDTMNLEPQQIYPLTNSGSGMVFGTVTLADGSVPEFGLDAAGNSLQTRVTLVNLTTGRPVATTLVNGLGEYVLPNVPLGTNLTLIAQAEAAMVQTNINTDTTGEADLVLPDSPPVIQSLLATFNGQAVNYAPPGATVQITVQASSPLGFSPLHYAWTAVTRADGLVNTDAPTTSLTMPTNEGSFVQLSVEVSDGHGGYASMPLQLVAEDQLAFSGYVTGLMGGTNSIVLTNASIVVNGIVTNTDTNGFFELTVPAFPATNFFLSISAPGFNPLFATYTGSAVQQNYTLISNSLACIAWDGQQVQITDPAGSGAAITLQADSLLDLSNSNYTGDICVSFAVYDTCSDSVPLPAGNDAIDASNNQAFLLPQAMASITIADPMGNPLTLKPGLPATVTLPPGQSCPAPTNAPDTVPGWVWDAANNTWRTNGQAANGPGGGPFIGPAAALGLMAAGPAPLKGELNLGVDKTINNSVDVRLSSQPALIELIGIAKVPIPLNVPITFQVLSPKEAPGDFYTDPGTPATLRQPKDKTVILQVTKTFNQTGTALTLSLSTDIPALTEARVQKSEHFLTFKSGQVTSVLSGGPPPKPTSDDRVGAVEAYYNAIGFPRNLKMKDWEIKNGFLAADGTTYSEDAGALYYNATDLGFARAMHMKTKVAKDGKKDIAYYVVNYFTLKDALDDLQGESPAQPEVATVAMDYALDANNKRITKFYVFENGSLKVDADLEKTGNGMVVPNLCVTCHGTTPVQFTFNPNKLWSIAPKDGDVKGRFMPFDIQSFTYTSNVVKDKTSKKNMGGVQTDQFKLFNQGIYENTPLNAAMKELLEGWYGGAGLPNAAFNPNFVPDGWKNTVANPNSASLYTSAFQVSCRACHVMRDKVSFNSIASLAAPGTVAKAKKLVCQTLEMPNAQRTFTIFWGSKAANVIKNNSTPNQPDLMANQFGWGQCPAAAPPPP